jgi:hypothetical protein
MSTAKENLALARDRLAANDRAAVPIHARVAEREAHLAEKEHELDVLGAAAAKAEDDGNQGAWATATFASKRLERRLAEDRAELAKAVDAANAVARRRPDLLQDIDDAMSLVIKEESESLFAVLDKAAERFRTLAARVMGARTFIASKATPPGTTLATGRGVALLRLASEMVGPHEIGQVALAPSSADLQAAVAEWAARSVELTSDSVDSPEREMAAE